MKIDDIKETVALARLDLGDDELGTVLPCFEQFLDYFAVLDAAGQEKDLFPDAAGADAVRLKASEHFRPDAAGGDIDTRLNDSLLNNAGERDGRFLVIPNVL
jgi:aspartyl-tRNA(Asn)/glutamyl-tRNA(Gln) amidotransferase subunit C